MGSISNYLENEMLDHFTGVGAYTPPTIYAGVSTADPTDDASGIAEPSSGSYARVLVSSWADAASRATSNSGIITFPTATGAWGTLTYWFISDALTAGNMLAHGSLGSKAVVEGQTPTIAGGQCSITAAASGSGGGWTDHLVHEMLDHVFGVGAYTAPDIYATFSTTTPTDSGPNVTEPSGSNFARKLHAAWTASSGGACENDGAITFNTPSGSWGTCTHLAAYDAITDGNCLFWGNTTDQEPLNGNTVQIAGGALDLTLA